MPYARPLEPGAPCLPPRLGFSCFKDKSFMTWRAVLAQGMNLLGHPVPCHPFVCSHCSVLHVFLIASSKPSGGGDQHPHCMDEESEEQRAK